MELRHVFCLLVLVPLLAKSNEIIPAVSDQFRYKDITDTVFAAGARYNPLSVREDREFIGAVLSYPDGYNYTVAEGIPGQDEVTTKIKIPRGSKLVALWHTHGAPHYSRSYFSSVDTRLVARLGVPFYLIDPDNGYSVFRPGDRLLTARQSRRLGLGFARGYAKGTLIGFNPSGER